MKQWQLVRKIRMIIILPDSFLIFHSLKLQHQELSSSDNIQIKHEIILDEIMFFLAMARYAIEKYRF